MIISAMSSLETPLPPNLTPLLPYYCELFATSHKVTAFIIKHMQTLLSNHPGTLFRSILTNARGCAPQEEHAVPASPFRMNTCKSVTKQTTSTPFKINTYAK